MRKLMTEYQLFGTKFCDQIISGEYHRLEDELLGVRGNLKVSLVVRTLAQ